VVIGTSSMTFEGNTCDNIISIRYRLNHHQPGISDSNFTFSLNFKEWDNKDITSLPYFDSIYEILNKINEGWLLNTSMDFEGKKLRNCSLDKAWPNYYLINFSASIFCPQNL
jgi:hypothetical protein